MGKKTEMKVQPLVQQSSEDAAKLANLLAATASDEGPGDGELPATFVPQSDVPLPQRDYDPTGAQVAALLGGAGTHKRSDGSAHNFVASEKYINHYAPGVMDSLKQALEHKEDVRTMGASYGHGTDELKMPASARDIPNGLYQYRDPRTNRIIKVDERAKKIFEVIMGPLAPRVFRLCAQKGFDKKPLLCISQLLSFHLDTDQPHDPSGYMDSQLFIEQDGERKPIPYVPEVDEAQSSDLVRTFGKLMNAQTLRRLQQQAKYHRVGIFPTFRQIMLDICNAERISDPANDAGVAPLPGANVGRD